MSAIMRIFIPKSCVLSKSTRRALGIVFSFLLVIVMNGCALPFLAELDSGDNTGSRSDNSEMNDGNNGSGLEPLMIPVTAESFTVAWDTSSSSVDEYVLYYRPHGETHWHTLSAVDAGAAEGGSVAFEVNKDVLEAGPGEYEFAVSSVYDGEESELHTSLCEEAEPDRGWYVSWELS